MKSPLITLFLVAAGTLSFWGLSWDSPHIVIVNDATGVAQPVDGLATQLRESFHFQVSLEPAPGQDLLDQADLVILLAGNGSLTGGASRPLRAYLNAGRASIGLAVGSEGSGQGEALAIHALGGRHPIQSEAVGAESFVLPRAATHPILRGIPRHAVYQHSGLRGAGTLSEAASPLLLARTGPEAPAVNVVWTHAPRPASRQVFVVAGRPQGQFRSLDRQIVLNAVFWALGKRVPPLGVLGSGVARDGRQRYAGSSPPVRQTPPEVINLSQNLRDSWNHPPERSGATLLVARPGMGDHVSRRRFSDYRLQLDFRIPPSSPDTRPIWRGNSGIFLNGSYEIQLLEPAPGEPTETSCGALNGVRAPDQDACRGAGRWQQLDVRVRAARFENGARVSNARLTVLLNGTRVHDGVEMEGPTPGGLPEEGAAEGAVAGPIRIQADSGAVEFANIWVQPFLDEDLRFAFAEQPPLTGNRWEDMDYGPFLTTSIEAPEPEGNIAYKGIAVPLEKAWDARRQETIVFDTDLLRYAFGWEGGFLEMRGVVFDGTHNTHPLMQGTQLFSSPLAPGWSSDGKFEDPRSMRWEPLPREMARYQGLSLYKNRVVFSYRVGESQVLDMPGLQTEADGQRAFTRDLEVETNQRGLTVQVASGRGDSARFLHLPSLQAATASDPAHQTIAVVENGTGVLAAAVVGAPNGSRWRVQGPHIRLHLPPSESTTRLRILMWTGDGADVGDLAQLVTRARPLTPLIDLTRGGPSRWPDRLVTKGQIGPDDGPFAVDRIAWPDPNPWRSWIRFGSFDFFRDPSRAALTTWNGDVWLVSGLDEDLDRLQWQRIATGLYQPLGLKVVEEDIYVLARDQITILRDRNGDGEADYYENFINDLQNTEHFHEFAMDLQTDARGDFYFMKGGRHAKDSLIPQHGTLLKASRDGSSLEIMANGFRAPNGLLIRPDGKFVSTDQQGHWVPANRINILEPDGFYGYMWSFHRGERPTGFQDPLLWIHPAIDRSPSSLVWSDSPAWPQLREKMLSLSYGMGKIDLVLTEEVDGKVQGALTRLPLDFETGIMRGRFHPRDGQLYTAGLFGWAGNKIAPGGFYRIRRTQQPLHMPVAFETARDGIAITFANPLDPSSATDPGNFHVQEWNYQWRERYGSPDFKRDGREGRDEVPVQWSALSPDRKTVFLKLQGLTPAMQVHTEFSLRAADGSSIRNFLHGSVFKLPNRSWEDIVDSGWSRSAADGQPRDEALAAGLLQEIRPFAVKHVEADYRTTRLAALHVPEEADPSPFVPAGRFASRWRGYLRSELNTTVQFSFRGRGRVRLLVNGSTLADTEEGPLDDVVVEPVELSGGLNTIDLTYHSPPAGDAAFRLLWSSDEWATEPVPPGSFLHQGDDDRLIRSRFNRQGRNLFARHKCLNCHRPEKIEWPHESSMPELVALAPRLDGIASKLRHDWLVDWIESPSQVEEGARMPSLLKGPDTRQQAVDIVSFLASRSRPPAAEPPNWAKSPDTIGRGRTLVATLGCLACHSLTDTPDKESLDDVGAEWYPRALAEYLRAPQEHEEWSEMPDFGLSRSEAEAIAAYLMTLGTRSGSLPQGDPQRGAELVRRTGCANCHELSGFQAQAAGPAFETLRRRAWSTGCLAETSQERGDAPDFHLSDSDRRALTSFVQDSTHSLRRRDWAEFAARQTEALGCRSCHSQDSHIALWSPPTAESGAAREATIHLKIPDLTWAGEKLRPPWMESLIGGELPYKTRPRLPARMPAFPTFAAGLATGLASQHGIASAAAQDSKRDSRLALVGRDLTGPQQLACTQCHPVAGLGALAGADTETIDLQHMGERLHKEFFERLLRDPSRVIPGTMMPSFLDEQGRSTLQGVLDGDGSEQSRALWEYLRSLP